MFTPLHRSDHNLRHFVENSSQRKRSKVDTLVDSMVRFLIKKNCCYFTKLLLPYASFSLVVSYAKANALDEKIQKVVIDCLAERSYKKLHSQLSTRISAFQRRSSSDDWIEKVLRKGVIDSHEDEWLKIAGKKGSDGKTLLHKLFTQLASSNDLSVNPIKMLFKELVSYTTQEHIKIDEKGTTEIHESVRLGELENYLSCLDNPGIVDIRDGNQNTPLHIAVQEKNIDAFSLLISKKANVGLANNEGKTPVFLVIEELEKTTNKEEKKLLLEMLETLIEKGASLDVRDKEDEPLAHYVIKNLESFCSLKKKTAPIEKNPFKRAAQEVNKRDQGTRFFAKYLLKNMDLNIQTTKYNEKENTILHIAIATRNTGLIDLLLKERGRIDLNKKNVYGDTPLHMAASKLDEETVDKLVIEGANYNIRNALKQTPLAVLENAYKALSRNSPVNKKDLEGNAPLHSAIQDINMDYFRVLIKRNADVNITNAKGKTPIFLIIDELKKNLSSEYGKIERGGLVDMEEILLKKGSLVFSKSESGEKERKLLVKMAEILLKKGGLVLSKDEKGNNILHTAIEIGNADLIDLLLKKRPQIDLKEKNLNGDTALHIAASKGDKETVKKLLKKGASHNIVNLRGKTALQVAKRLAIAPLTASVRKEGTFSAIV